MALHARRKGTNAALIYFPFCAWSLIEDLPKASFCFITISFVIILRCCLHFMNFLFNVQNRKYTQALLHRTVHKISFPTSLYFPKLAPDKRVTSVLLRWWNLSWNFRTHNTQCFLHNSGSSNSLVLDAFECKLDGTSGYLIFFICTTLNKLSNWWRQQHLLRDLERLMIYLATLLDMTSFF
jgi:hypothetical protein